jgi:hypothetical protein
VKHDTTKTDTGEPTDSAEVDARHGALVITVYLSNPDKPIDIIDHTVVTTTAAVLGMLGQS